MSQPISVPSNGTMKLLAVPTIAVITVPTVTELTAMAVTDLTCYATGDGLTTNTTENTIDDARLCSFRVYQQPGDSTEEVEITYVFNPAVPTSDKARIALPRGTQTNLVIRWAMLYSTAIVAAQIVDVYPVTMGEQRKVTAGRNSVHRITQRAFVRGEVAKDVAVAA